VKTCPVCGASAGDDDAFCEADGVKLVGASYAVTLPARAGRGPSTCGSCGLFEPDDGDGYCKQCGHRLGDSKRAESLWPGATLATDVGQLTVVRTGDESQVTVTDSAGKDRTLVFGTKEAMGHEAAALATAGASFASILARGTMPLGEFLVLGADLTEARPLVVHAPMLSFPEGLVLMRRLLDLAAGLAERGFAWEPAAEDLYVTPAGSLISLRARRARPLLTGEPLNAKTVLEALGALLPIPAAMGTPDLVRMILPAFNSSTPRTRTIEAARQVIDEADRVARATRSTASLAELCDPGLRRNHNEDATGAAQGETSGEPWTVLVVCDGVSSSTHADQASRIAAKVATDTLSHFARSGDITFEGAQSALMAAIRAAHLSICTSDIDYGDNAPPGTTIVAALVFRKRLTVGWVGDSRAYWVSEHGAELCTTDHSWVNEALARGEVTESEAMASPLAHALTKCLGPLEMGEGATRDVEPEVRTKALPGPGHVVLCTDGLWNYFPSATVIAELVRDAGPDADPVRIARFLVCQALAQGGGDNVSVAVYESR